MIFIIYWNEWKTNVCEPVGCFKKFLAILHTISSFVPLRGNVKKKKIQVQFCPLFPQLEQQIFKSCMYLFNKVCNVCNAIFLTFIIIIYLLRSYMQLLCVTKLSVTFQNKKLQDQSDSQPHTSVFICLCLVCVCNSDNPVSFTFLFWIMSPNVIMNNERLLWLSTHMCASMQIGVSYREPVGDII